MSFFCVADWFLTHRRASPASLRPLRSAPPQPAASVAAALHVWCVCVTAARCVSAITGSSMTPVCCSLCQCGRRVFVIANAHTPRATNRSAGSLVVRDVFVRCACTHNLLCCFFLFVSSSRTFANGRTQFAQYIAGVSNAMIAFIDEIQAKGIDVLYFLTLQGADYGCYQTNPHSRGAPEVLINVRCGISAAA